MVESGYIVTAPADDFPEQASYAVALAYKVRFYLHLNARSAMHVRELRCVAAEHHVPGPLQLFRGVLRRRRKFKWQWHLNEKAALLTLSYLGSVRIWLAAYLAGVNVATLVLYAYDKAAASRGGAPPGPGTAGSRRRMPSARRPAGSCASRRARSRTTYVPGESPVKL